MAVRKPMTKPEAILAAEQFLKEVRELSEKYGVSFNSDTGDIYLQFYLGEEYSNGGSHWDHVKVGWKGDGTGIRVIEPTAEEMKEELRESALSKLTDEERKALGL